MALALNEELKTLLKGVREKRNFDPEKWIEKKCTLFNEYMKKSGLKGCVVNISGGIDSSVTAALVHHASKMPGFFSSFLLFPFLFLFFLFFFFFLSNFNIDLCDNKN